MLELKSQITTVELFEICVAGKHPATYGSLYAYILYYIPNDGLNQPDKPTWAGNQLFYLLIVRKYYFKPAKDLCYVSLLALYGDVLGTAFYRGQVSMADSEGWWPQVPSDRIDGLDKVSIISMVYI